MLRAHRSTHRLIWRALALLIPAILLLSFLSRPPARLPAPVPLAPATPK